MYAKCGALEKAKEVLQGLPVRSAVSWNALIAGYVQVRNFEGALKSLQLMQEDGFFPNAVTFVCLLKTFGSMEDLERGQIIHSNIVKQGLLGVHAVLGNALVDMYAKCGAFAKAKEVFEELPVHDAVSWNAMIARYVQREHSQMALNCFELMQFEGIFPDSTTFVCVLKACGSIEEIEKGEDIYMKIVRLGLLHGNAVLGGAIVDMYAKCGVLAKAKEVLEGLPMRDVVSWSALIAGYVLGEHAKEALECFERMQSEGFTPNAVTLISILKACGSLGALGIGESVHSQIVSKGLLADSALLGGALVDMYVKCNALAKAREVLMGLPVRTIVSWSVIIAGYVQEDEAEEALNCFTQMQSEGFFPDALTFASILKACGSIGALEQGEKIHFEIVKKKIGGTSFFGHALVDMYARCGVFVKAKEVLEGLPFRDVLTWTVLIVGYAQGEHDIEAVNCFEQMQHEGVSPDVVTFVFVLKACANIGALSRGEGLHSLIMKQKLLAGNVALGGALIDMYVKCGLVSKAKEVLDQLLVRDVFNWNAVIAGYAEGEESKEALNCFEQLQCEGLVPNTVTFSLTLKACGTVGALEKGETMHLDIIRQGLLRYNILGNALVDMYIKCGALEKAKELLEGLLVRDVISWNTLMTGYVQAEYGHEALNCFKQMQLDGLSPSMVTFLCILKACGNIGALDKGEILHFEVVRQGLLVDNVVLGGALVDMYAKCGAFVKAKNVLEELLVRDVAAWNALIAGYAHGEHAMAALNCFEQMQHEGLFPDGITFVCVLSACSHLGLLDEGKNCYRKMITDYGILPAAEHQSCMITLFGRAGCLDEAAAVIKKMLSSTDDIMWRALISACKDLGDLELGRWAFEHAKHRVPL